ncbi:hypothetical protein MMPV_007850 [Pyropia vietnamensis]
MASSRSKKRGGGGGGGGRPPQNGVTDAGAGGSRGEAVTGGGTAATSNVAPNGAVLEAAEAPPSLPSSPPDGPGGGAKKAATDGGGSADSVVTGVATAAAASTAVGSERTGMEGAKGGAPSGAVTEAVGGSKPASAAVDVLSGSVEHAAHANESSERVKPAAVAGTSESANSASKERAAPLGANVDAAMRGANAGTANGKGSAVIMGAAAAGAAVAGVHAIGRDPLDGGSHGGAGGGGSAVAAAPPPSTATPAAQANGGSWSSGARIHSSGGRDTDMDDRMAAAVSAGIEASRARVRLLEERAAVKEAEREAAAARAALAAAEAEAAAGGTGGGGVASGGGAADRGRLGDLVREDGSVDLPALRAKVAAAVDKLGETWSRLNGEAPARVGDDQDEEAVASAIAARKVALAVAASVDASSRQDAIDVLERELQEASKAREAVLRKEDQLGKLIRAKEIRAMDDSVSRVRRTLAVQVLALEMEKAYASLASEVEAASEPVEERLLVADFGELDLRLAPLVVFADMGEPLLIDDDDLGQLAAEIQYLKVRMGLGDDFYSATIDWPRVKKYIKESFSKAKDGAEFYIRGFKLVGGDSIYAARLIRKAAMGRTLLPREVRTLRRTGRDLLAVIPFSIILIAPLTPLGHVLIFSFLQRFFPDFFPSTFNERRQALMRRHEELRKTISAASESGEVVSQADVHLAD